MRTNGIILQNLQLKMQKKDAFQRPNSLSKL
ncbi:hypothetical protein NTHI1209_01088 [Haemophilus influenzae]|uniref:Uncharacterized protein n=1 Tax=Haemophilus influenzae TaxID=727 RepID=A0A158SX87_HAEIF|nr:hypothetical protein NTHI1209_01088 [Haemophilus influenzae]